MDHSARREIGNNGKSVITRIKLNNEIDAGNYDTRVNMGCKERRMEEKLKRKVSGYVKIETESDPPVFCHMSLADLGDARDAMLIWAKNFSLSCSFQEKLAK